MSSWVSLVSGASVVVGGGGLFVGGLSVGRLLCRPPPLPPLALHALSDSVATALSGLALVVDGVVRYSDPPYGADCSRYYLTLWLLLLTLLTAGVAGVGTAWERRRAWLSEQPAQPQQRRLAKLATAGAWGGALLLLGVVWANTHQYTDSSSLGSAFLWKASHQPPRQGRDFLQDLWNYNGKRGDMTSDYKENLVIGLVKGVAAGNISHQQMAGLYGVGGGQGLHTAAEGSGAGEGGGHGQHSTNTPYTNSETYQGILAWHDRLGFHRGDVLKVFTPNINTINDTKDGPTTMADKTRPPPNESTPEHEFINTRNSFPSMAFASSGVPLINTSQLYQMIRRNLTQTRQTRPTDGDNPTAVVVETTIAPLLGDTDYGGGEGSLEATTVSPTDDDVALPGLDEGGGGEDLVQTDAGTTTNEELVTRTDSSGGISGHGEEDWANTTMKKCYMKEDFSQVFVTLVFTVLFCVPVLATCLPYTQVMYTLDQQASEDTDTTQVNRVEAEGPWNRAQKSSLKQAVTVLASYILCWLPFLLERLIHGWQDILHQTSMEERAAEGLFLLAYVHGVLRGVLYVANDIQTRTTISTTPTRSLDFNTQDTPNEQTRRNPVSSTSSTMNF